MLLELLRRVPRPRGGARPRPAPHRRRLPLAAPSLQVASGDSHRHRRLLHLAAPSLQVGVQRRGEGRAVVHGLGGRGLPGGAAAGRRRRVPGARPERSDKNRFGVFLILGWVFLNFSWV